MSMIFVTVTKKFKCVVLVGGDDVDDDNDENDNKIIA